MVKPPFLVIIFLHFSEKDKKGEAAAFLTKLTDYDVLLGGTARFTACVMGSPKPDLTWYEFFWLSETL